MRPLRENPISNKLETINCTIELKDIDRLLYYEERKNTLSKKSANQLRSWLKRYCKVINPLLTNTFTRYHYLDIIFQYLYHSKNPSIHLIKSIQPKYVHIQTDYPESISKLLIGASKIIDVSIKHHNKLNKILKNHHHKIRDFYIDDTSGEILGTIPHLNIETLHLSKVHFKAFENHIHIKCTEFIMNKCTLNQSFFNHVSVCCKHITVTSTNITAEEIIQIIEPNKVKSITLKHTQTNIHVLLKHFKNVESISLESIDEIFFISSKRVNLNRLKYCEFKRLTIPSTFMLWCSKQPICEFEILDCKIKSPSLFEFIGQKSHLTYFKLSHSQIDARSQRILENLLQTSFKKSTIQYGAKRTSTLDLNGLHHVMTYFDNEYAFTDYKHIQFNNLVNQNIFDLVHSIIKRNKECKCVDFYLCSIDQNRYNALQLIFPRIRFRVIGLQKHFHTESVVFCD